ncbi:MAG: hypothetical protein JW702_03980 [Clostridiales bacterium]|nr:hypothetical protein [Clostridiales bacterium]
MLLIDELKNKYRTISLVGMVKNAGKTTLLNEFINQAYLESVTLGLTSIGYDGETNDSVTNTPKPYVEVFPGTLIATAKNLLNTETIKYEVLEVTDFLTVLGPIVIVRIRSRAQVILIGPRSNEGLEEVSRMMRKWGADLVFVDGALDRVSSASPALADAVFLATGAALSRDINQVVIQTLHRIHLLKLKKVDECIEIFKCLKDENQIGIIDEVGHVYKMDLKTGINSGDELKKHLDKHSKFVFFPGAVTYNMLKDIVMFTHGKVAVIVSDGSKIFIEREPYIDLVSKGLEIAVLDEINLIGVSINPVSPKGYYFDERVLKKKLMEKIDDLLLVNVYDS